MTDHRADPAPEAAPPGGASLEELAAQLRGLQTHVDELEAAGLLGADPNGTAQDSAEPYYPSVQAFVDDYFVHCYARPTGGEYRWCRRWWDHAEAITRLEALWRSWEAMTRDPALGMATWLTNYLDPQLRVLLDRHGPFAHCSDDRHDPLKSLPVDEPPQALWELSTAVS